MLRIETIALLVVLLGACAGRPDKYDPEATLAQAVALMKAHDLDKALLLLREADQMQAMQPLVRVNIAIILRTRGDVDGAEQMLGPVFELQDIPPAAAYNQMGLIYREQGRFDEARDIYRRGLLHYSGYSFLARNLGVLCELYLRDMPCAEDAYASYLEMVDRPDAEGSASMPGAAGDDEQVRAWLDTTRSRE